VSFGERILASMVGMGDGCLQLIELRVLGYECLKVIDLSGVGECPGVEEWCLKVRELMRTGEGF
jgi:hypothetical protein